MKNKIVSKLFDTINKLSTDEIRKDEMYEEDVEDNIEGKVIEYIVSVPNETNSLKFTNEKPILICIYGIRTDGLYPFILYLLHKTETEQVTFISMPLLNCCIGSKKIKYAAQAYLRTILPALAFTYAGFCETFVNNIIIYKCAEQNMVEMEDDYVWATAFEMFNKKKIMDYTFHKSITNFFTLNSEFLRLKTPGNRIYESPMIGYYSSTDTCERNEMDIYRETIIPALGKCYYLFAELPHKQSSETSILRIVFFAGRMALYVDNINYERINYERINYERINYDSILCREYKRYIIQNYNQHVVLF